MKKLKPYQYEKLHCPECHEKQWSAYDRIYVALFGHCWTCDKKLWEKGRLTTELFEERENLTLEQVGK